MPSAASLWVWSFNKSIPSHSMRPLDALRSLITLFMSVVLPAPLRPMRPAMLPVGSSRETPRRICTDWMATLRFSTLNTLRLDSLKLSPYYITTNLGIVQRGLGRRVGDDAAFVEGEHALREAAHHLHVVLDEEHSGALGSCGEDHPFHDAELLLGGDAARRLVQQQDARSCGHGECDVEELPHA